MKKLPALTFLLLVLMHFSATAQNVTNHVRNLAVLAYCTQADEDDEVTRLSDGLVPVNTGRRQYPGRPVGTQWVRYKWNHPVRTAQIEIFWWDFDGSVRLPSSYRLKYWNGSEFLPVANAKGLETGNNRFNITKFDEVSTTMLRLEIDSTDRNLPAMLEWRVIQAENSPDMPPVVIAGPDRSVMPGGKTWLSGRVKMMRPVSRVIWTKKSGPGTVQFADETALNTTAVFSQKGEYELLLTAHQGDLASSSSLRVKVTDPPEAKRLDVVYTKRYKINSPLWNARAKAIMVNWIPWCIDQINRTGLKTGQGGIDNFIEAGKALRGEPHGKHLGYVFSNAWVHQTVESMSIALMIDPEGDPEITRAQEKMKKTLDSWIPVILAAQEPDGYLQTAFTLRDTSRWQERWAPRTRGNHEGYVAGYFIESAINHYTLTGGSDRRLYDGAKKLADCWVANIGPGKKEWFDGHQEMEQALVRFGRFVNDMEGNGHGDSYISLAKYLLDCRKNGTKYDQSHVPVQQQYEAVGHAVRAAYHISAMSDVAAETGDIDYQSAVMSMWDNLVNKKYYLTGGIGSGETAEGFGDDYSLPNEAYCEACSSCGLIFFQHKMNLAYHDAKYADLYEETFYNALLGSLDLEGKNFYYDNPLESSVKRYSWHVCPCCVGNIPRTLLMIPTWAYVKGDNGLYVNMFIGSTIRVENIGGSDIELIQKTDYPWSGKVTITVNPEKSKTFSMYIRVPDRTTSQLYDHVPRVNGLKSLKVNGKPVSAKIIKGYAEINRTWNAGDRVDLELPMDIQKITADPRIEDARNRIALRMGPMIYNVEKADQPDIDRYIGTSRLKTEWREDLLGGVVVIKGKWEDGSPLIAIPNYARDNRVPENPDGKAIHSMVWIKSR